MYHTILAPTVKPIYIANMLIRDIFNLFFLNLFIPKTRIYIPKVRYAKIKPVIFYIFAGAILHQHLSFLNINIL